MAAPEGNQYAKGHGRPTLYRDEYVDMAYKFCLLGATDKQLGDMFGVCEKTINQWKTEYPKFNTALKNGKDVADANVSKSLYHRATGYEHDEDKIFLHEGQPVVVPTKKRYPPDTTAAIFWLKNRQTANWRDKQDIEHSGQQTQKIILVEEQDAEPTQEADE